MEINNYVPDIKIFENMTPKTEKSDKVQENGIMNFADLLKSKLDGVNDAQINAENSSEQFAKGQGPDIHQVSLAVSEASLSLDMAVQIRNKLVEAYQELNRMQL